MLKIKTATKQLVCADCGKPIEIGERYWAEYRNGLVINTHKNCEDVASNYERMHVPIIGERDSDD
jgi:hypothetical protein